MAAIYDSCAEKYRFQIDEVFTSRRIALIYLYKINLLSNSCQTVFTGTQIAFIKLHT